MPQQDEQFPTAQYEWDREVQILLLLAKRRKINDIAGQYHISGKTVSRLRDKALKYPQELRSKLPGEVQDYLLEWGSNHRPQLINEQRIQQNWIKHSDDLAQATREVLKRLYTYIHWNNNMTIEDINLEKNDAEATGFFTDKIVIGLFTHLQHDILVPQQFKSWEELKVKNITVSLLNELSLKAAKRDFNGKCEICGGQVA
jgi:hypothetical protein